MKQQLLERGLGESEFDPRDGRPSIANEELKRLCLILASIEDALIALERRGISLKAHAARLDSNRKLPVFHVYLGHEEFWFGSRTELDEFLHQQELSKGGELSVKESRQLIAGESSEENGAARSVHITELHEVRTINAGLADLAKMNFDIQSLIPQERVGTEEPRYVLRRGDHESVLIDLRGLLSAVRDAGQKGLSITRFKGLGEMNAEELRETTLDPANRTLIQVSMVDAGAADEMFRVLMGDKVEPRREFIEKHALEVRNLDV
jgi:DNA gyrase subunit B